LLGLDVQAKSTATIGDLLSMYTGRVLNKPSPQLLLTPDEQSDCDEANDISNDNHSWHNSQNNMPTSHILNSITKEKSSVQDINIAVNKAEEGNSKKVDYINEHLRIIISFFCFFLFFLLLFSNFIFLFPSSFIHFFKRLVIIKMFAHQNIFYLTSTAT